MIAAILSLLPFDASIRVARASDMLAVGATFPAWQLADHNGSNRSSEEMAGKKYLLWFYPKAMTPGCTAEGRGLREAYAEFQANDIAVFGISADDSAANAAFVEAESFPFPLLSDPDLTLASKVGADGILGYTRRISYVIGADGKVVKAYADVDPAGHAEQVLRDLAPAESPD
jgi:peroxiredoxin Q/BCP